MNIHHAGYQLSKFLLVAIALYAATCWAADMKSGRLLVSTNATDNLGSVPPGDAVFKEGVTIGNVRRTDWPTVGAGVTNTIIITNVVIEVITNTICEVVTNTVQNYLTVTNVVENYSYITNTVVVTNYVYNVTTNLVTALPPTNALWIAASGGKTNGDQTGMCSNQFISLSQGRILSPSVASRLAPIGQYVTFLASDGTNSTLLFPAIRTPSNWSTNGQVLKLWTGAVSGVATTSFRLFTMPVDGTTNLPYTSSSWQTTNQITTISGAAASSTNIIQTIPAGLNMMLLQWQSGTNGQVQGMEFGWIPQ